MPLVILDCKITGGIPKGTSRRIPAITRASLRAVAGFWFETQLERHFTPGNESRYRYDRRNPVYLSKIKPHEGSGQGKYVSDILKGQSLRWLRSFASVTGPQRQATIRMVAPTYFEKPFIGTTVDPKNGRLKHVTRQPDKPKEVTTISDADREALNRFGQGDARMRTELLMRSIGVGRK